MRISVLGISVDAVDAARLANFWARALYGTFDDGATQGFASIAAETDSQRGPLLMFHKVPAGKTVKNRAHFDLQAAAVATEADRLR
jgi:Glyoxalase-like domain